MARNNAIRSNRASAPHSPRHITSSFSVSPVRTAIANSYSAGVGFSYSGSAVRTINPSTKTRGNSYAMRVPKKDKVHLELHQGTLNEGASLVRSVLMLATGIITIVIFVLILNSYATSIAYENVRVHQQITQTKEEIQEIASKGDNVPNVNARAVGLGMVQRQGVIQLYLSNNQVSKVDPNEKVRDYLSVTD